MSEPSRLLITGGYINFITNNIQGQGLGEQRLRNAILHEAMSLSHLPPACCPGTRLDILRRLLRWIDGSEGAGKTLWLIGGAASGKSALAQSIIQWCAHNSVPQGAIVFLFPTQPQAPENVWRYLIPTIACQIAAYIPAYLQELQEISQNMLQDIVAIPIEDQVELLISTPLSVILSSNPSTVLPRLIVIDGLDEFNCSSQSEFTETHKHVMVDVMLLALAQKPWFPFRLLITSRHPSWLPSNFRSSASVLASNGLDIISLESSDARPNIRTYFEAMFRSIREVDGPQTFAPRGEHDWEKIYDTLVTRTGGHFGHAASIHHFMHTNAITSLPEQRLQSLLNYPSSGNSQAALEATPFQQVDALFSSILKAATQQSTVDTAILIFAYYILPHSPRRGNRRLTVSEIEQFHNVRCKSLLPGLHPIIKVVEGRVELLYPCIAEYLLDKSRSGEFHVEPIAQYTLMAKSALAHISCSLVDSNGQPSIKDNVYALACESLKGLIHHAFLSDLSRAFEAIDFAHIQQCRIQGLDALCTFDTILTCADALPSNTRRTIHARLEGFIANQMRRYRSSTVLAPVMDLLACSELIELSGVSDHSVLLRVLLPEDTEGHRDDTRSLKIRQLLLFGRKCCPRYLAFIGRSVRRLLHQLSSMPGHDPPLSDRQVYSAIYTRHSQLLINSVNRLRSHVQHQIQSDSNTVVYCMRSLIAALSKAERSEAIAVMLRPENRPWNGLPPENLPSAIVQAADEAAQLYLRQHRA